MSEVKDSAIKLFGRTISLPPISNDSSAPASSPCEVSSATQHEAEGPSRKELTSVQDADEASHQTTDQDPKSATTTSSGLLENPPKTPSEERETSLLKPSTNGEQSETSASQDNKTPKKPDKILPCPRCNSMDTKFCYYNNYNVNQPRHFCKNCQRYWTAGGTMRNVPVGAGRRKNKNSPAAAQYHQIMVPDQALHQGNHPNGAPSVLTFGSSDSHLCDSMASALNIAENYTHNGNNGHHPIGVTNDQSMEKRVPQFPCFPTTSPWPYPWNTAMPASPAFCTPSYPVPFYAPSSYWGIVSPSWNMPCISPQSSVNQSAGHASSCPNSPTLGKHSRNGNIITPENNSEKERADCDQNSVLIPKTLRIHDPNEASKSSIWSTLGIRNEMANSNSLNGGGLFKAFPSKGNDKNNHMVEASVLHANPAALSRSLTFHEQT